MRIGWIYANLDTDFYAKDSRYQYPPFTFAPFQRRARNLRILQLTYAPRGVSVHYVSEELDSGEIIAQGAITKIAGESLESYEARIHKLEHTLYPLALLEALTRKK